MVRGFFILLFIYFLAFDIFAASPKNQSETHSTEKCEEFYRASFNGGCVNTLAAFTGTTRITPSITTFCQVLTDFAVDPKDPDNRKILKNMLELVRKN